MNSDEKLYFLISDRRLVWEACGEKGLNEIGLWNEEKLTGGPYKTIALRDLPSISIHIRRL